MNSSNPPDIKLKNIEIVPLTTEKLKLKIQHLTELDRQLNLAKIQYKEMIKLLKIIQSDYNKTVEELKGYSNDDHPNNGDICNTPKPDHFILMKKTKGRKPKNNKKIDVSDSK